MAHPRTIVARSDGDDLVAEHRSQSIECRTNVVLDGGEHVIPPGRRLAFGRLDRWRLGRHRITVERELQPPVDGVDRRVTPRPVAIRPTAAPSRNPPIQPSTNSGTDRNFVT